MAQSGHKSSFRLRRFPPAQVVIYVFVRVAMAAVCMFSPRMSNRIGRLIGRLLYALDYKHRRIALKNVAAADGMPKDPRAVARFVRRVYEHMGTVIVENLALSRRIAAGQVRGTRLENFEVLDRALTGGRGCIVVIGHLGNWEYIGLAATMAGYPLNSVARPIENPYLDRYVTRFRSLTGQRIIPKYNALYSMSDVLTRNEILVILADQDARRSGLLVPFLGQPASTVRSPALLSLRHGAPIVPANIWRDEDGVHHARVSEPLKVPEGASTEEMVRALTIAMNARLEQFVREHPTQWMWMHARWKTGNRVQKEQASRESTDAELSASPD